MSAFRRYARIGVWRSDAGSPPPRLGVNLLLVPVGSFYSNAIDPNAEDNCDDAETGNAQESNGYDELPELQAVVIDRALHDELTAGPTRPTERLLKGQRAPATCPLPKPRCSPRSVTNGIRRRRRGGHATRCLWRSHISHSQDRYRRFTGRDNCRGRSCALLARGLRVSSPRSG